MADLGRNAFENPPNHRALLELKHAAALAVLIAALGTEAAYRAVLRGRARALEEPGVFELYAVGESTMRGFPDSRLSPAVLASDAFAGRLGGRRIALRRLAQGGDSLYSQTLLFRDTATWRDRSRPGAVLIYSGHNEIVSVVGHPPGARAYQRFKELVVFRSFLLSDLLHALERRGRWIGWRDAASSEFYLKALLDAARRAGLTPILAVPAGNVADWEPGWFCSTAGCGLRVEEALAPGLEKERRGDWAGALERYTEAEASEAGLRPLLSFRRARCLRRLGRIAEAKKLFQTALDEDDAGGMHRATGAQVAMIRRIAGDEGVAVADAAAAFEARSPDGLPGSDLFSDAQHPSPEGYRLLGEVYADALGRVFGARPGRVRSADSAGFHVAQGWNVVRYSFQQGDASIGLALAEKEFRRALRYSPGERCAELGLSLIRAARKHPSLLVEPAAIEALRRRGLPLRIDEPFRCGEVSGAERWAAELAGTGPGRNSPRSLEYP